jgi:hypothetical protein
MHNPVFTQICDPSEDGKNDTYIVFPHDSSNA